MGVVQDWDSSVVIAAIAAFAGLVVGMLGASWYWLEFNARFDTYRLATRTQADIVGRVAALERLRAGRSEDATKTLETLLDGDLLEARVLARAGHKFDENARRALEIELQARKVSGYEPQDPDVRVAVREAFDLVQGGGDPERAESHGRP